MRTRVTVRLLRTSGSRAMKKAAHLLLTGAGRLEQPVPDRNVEEAPDARSDAGSVPPAHWLEQVERMSGQFMDHRTPPDRVAPDTSGIGHEPQPLIHNPTPDGTAGPLERSVEDRPPTAVPQGGTPRVESPSEPGPTTFETRDEHSDRSQIEPPSDRPVDRFLEFPVARASTGTGVAAVDPPAPRVKPASEVEVPGDGSERVTPPRPDRSTHRGPEVREMGSEQWSEVQNAHSEIAARDERTVEAGGSPHPAVVDPATEFVLETAIRRRAPETIETRPSRRPAWEPAALTEEPVPTAPWPRIVTTPPSNGVAAHHERPSGIAQDEVAGDARSNTLERNVPFDPWPELPPMPGYETDPSSSLRDRDRFLRLDAEQRGT